MIRRNSIFTWMQTQVSPTILGKGIKACGEFGPEFDRPADWEGLGSKFAVADAAISESEIRILQGDLDQREVRTFAFTDEDYPKGLLSLRHPPPLIHVLGNIGRLNDPGFGICGARNSSETGLTFAMQFGALIAQLGVPEVSGYAKGVDTEAHLGSLRAGGSTVVVLAEGIKHFRSKRSFAGIKDLGNRMTVVSEFSPNQMWSVGAAMQRNRTICGLSQALVVVEANATGGTFNAGRECLSIGKPLFVVHYRHTTAMPEGNAALIKQGGIPITSLDALRTELLKTLAVKEAAPKQMSLIA